MTEPLLGKAIAARLGFPDTGSPSWVRGRMRHPRVERITLPYRSASRTAGSVACDQCSLASTHPESDSSRLRHDPLNARRSHRPPWKRWHAGPRDPCVPRASDSSANRVQLEMIRYHDAGSDHAPDGVICCAASSKPVVRTSFCSPLRIDRSAPGSVTTQLSRTRDSGGGGRIRTAESQFCRLLP